MTDHEIIKALENEIRSTEYVDSDYCDGVDLTLIKSVIVLINRQKAEIEKLERTISYLEGVCENTPDKVRAEAIKEFSEKLENEINRRTTFSRQQDKNVIHIIHNLLKEIVDE